MNKMKKYLIISGIVGTLALTILVGVNGDDPGDDVPDTGLTTIIEQKA